MWQHPHICPSFPMIDGVYTDQADREYIAEEAQGGRLSFNDGIWYMCPKGSISCPLLHIITIIPKNKTSQNIPYTFWCIILSIYVYICKLVLFVNQHLDRDIVSLLFEQSIGYWKCHSVQYKTNTIRVVIVQWHRHTRAYKYIFVFLIQSLQISLLHDCRLN